MNKRKRIFRFIDLFAGAGGLSEGFVQAGYKPIAHVEMEKAACNTLRTRAAYHFLKNTHKLQIYESYLKNEIYRDELYAKIPADVLSSIINMQIGEDTNKAIQKQIDKLLGTETVDLIIGGPPCQAYSLVGRARSATNMEGDPRNYLFVQYAEYLEKYKPKVFVFENVLGLKSAKGGYYLQQMEGLFKKKGYGIRLYTLEARNFGVLQNRKRVIILGWREDIRVCLPELNGASSSQSYLVRDLLEDLPVLHDGEGADKFLRYKAETGDYLKKYELRNGMDILTQHIARPQSKQDKEIYKIAVQKWNKKQERLNYSDLPDRLKTHKNESSFVDRFKVVAGDLPYSQTVVAHIAKDGHYYIHPDIKQNRSLTVREAARLQSFPDEYYFEGEKEGMNRTAAFKQIGNAVPPLMAKYVAEEIIGMLL